MSNTQGESNTNITKEPQKPFKPNKKQRKWLEAALDPDVLPQIKAIEEKTEIDRGHWYRWIKNPQFMQWWTKEWNRGMEKTGWYFDKIGMIKAGSDFRYFEAMLTRHHKFVKKVEVHNKESLDKETLENEIESILEAYENKGVVEKQQD